MFLAEQQKQFVVVDDDNIALGSKILYVWYRKLKSQF